MKRLRSTSAGRWWLVWVSGGREWVLGSSKAVNAACLAVFDPSTNSALSRQPESVKKSHMALYGPLRLMSGRKTARKRPKRGSEGKPKTQNTPRLAGNAPYSLMKAHLGDAKACSYRFIWPKPGTPGACLGGKRPENGRTATEFGLARPNFN